jgi:hypothetical protein
MGSGPRSTPASEARHADHDARSGKVRGALWLLLVILALGTGAMATVYYWPDL